MHVVSDMHVTANCAFMARLLDHVVKLAAALIRYHSLTFVNLPSRLRLLRRPVVSSAASLYLSRCPSLCLFALAPHAYVQNPDVSQLESIDWQMSHKIDVKWRADLADDPDALPLVSSSPAQALLVNVSRGER